jgi:SAM-dependent methyltransferase
MSIGEVIQILTLVLLAIIFSGVMYLWVDQILYNMREHQIGYFPSLVPGLQKKIQTLLKKYHLSPDQSAFVELGCGLGSVCFFAYKKLTFKRVVGVDLNGILITLARFWNSFKGSGVELVKSDVYKYKIPSKAFVYCYLGGTIMTELYHRQLFADTFLVSITFPIKDIEPTEVIKLGGFYKKMYVYDFRQG